MHGPDGAVLAVEHPAAAGLGALRARGRDGRYSQAAVIELRSGQAGT
jgi:hypothetical protein